MWIAVIGIDLGKNSCSVVGLDDTGKVVLRRRMRRETVIAFADKLAACVVANRKYIAEQVTLSVAGACNRWQSRHAYR